MDRPEIVIYLRQEESPEITRAQAENRIQEFKKKVVSKLDQRNHRSTLRFFLNNLWKLENTKLLCEVTEQDDFNSSNLLQLSLLLFFNEKKLKEIVYFNTLLKTLDDKVSQSLDENLLASNLFKITSFFINEKTCMIDEILEQKTCQEPCLEIVEIMHNNLDFYSINNAENIFFLKILCLINPECNTLKTLFDKTLDIPTVSVEDLLEEYYTNIDNEILISAPRSTQAYRDQIISRIKIIITLLLEVLEESEVSADN